MVKQTSSMTSAVKKSNASICPCCSLKKMQSDVSIVNQGLLGNVDLPNASLHIYF